MVETDGLIEAVLRETEQARRPRMYAVWPGTSLCGDDVGKGVCTGLMIPLDHAEMNGMIVVTGYPAACRAEYYCAQGERARSSETLSRTPLVQRTLMSVKFAAQL